QHAAGAYHRLADEGGDGVRSLVHDHLLELVGQPAGELFLALAVVGVAVVMRAGSVQDVGDRQVEIAIIPKQTSKTTRGNNNTMINTQPRDDLLLLKPT